MKYLKLTYLLLIFLNYGCLGNKNEEINKDMNPTFQRLDFSVRGLTYDVEINGHFISMFSSDNIQGSSGGAPLIYDQAPHIFKKGKNLMTVKIKEVDMTKEPMLVFNINWYGSEDFANTNRPKGANPGLDLKNDAIKPGAQHQMEFDL